MTRNTSARAGSRALNSTSAALTGAVLLMIFASVFLVSGFI